MNRPLPLTPKPTIYAGQCFRSRLEARWAVFLDTLNLNWVYEGLTFSQGQAEYTPDFLIITPDNRQQLHILEVKPVVPEQDYFDWMRAITRFNTASQYSYLAAVMVGDFYASSPEVYLTRHSHFTLRRYLAEYFNVLPLPYIKAIRNARHFRFDLHS